MIPKEILKQVKTIEIKTTRLVNDMVAGHYESVFKGSGIEFAEVREYSPGDDIRSIDWNVTARMGHPFIKIYSEERELSVIFAVDASASLHFGSHQKLKSEIAAEVCALLSFAAVKNNDKIGLVIFTDKVEQHIPVKKGRRHVLRVIREILYYKPQEKGTKIRVGLEHLTRVLTRRAIIFVISDFLDSDYSFPLKVLARDHDVVALHIFDPREYSIPNVGFIELHDAEKNTKVLLNTTSKSFREQYATTMSNKQKELDDYFKSIGVDKVDIDVSKPYIDPLRAFFAMREQRI
jgi:uncharacterized protein (DUF58 family)